MKLLFAWPILAVVGWLTVSSLRADEADNLQQVIDLASKNADPQTSAQVAVCAGKPNVDCRSF